MQFDYCHQGLCSINIFLLHCCITYNFFFWCCGLYDYIRSFSSPFPKKCQELNDLFWSANTFVLFVAGSEGTQQKFVWAANFKVSQRLCLCLEMERKEEEKDVVRIWFQGLSLVHCSKQQRYKEGYINTVIHHIWVCVNESVNHFFCVWVKCVSFFFLFVSSFFVCQHSVGIKKVLQPKSCVKKTFDNTDIRSVQLRKNDCLDV